jgi:hypothetical protein
MSDSAQSRWRERLVFERGVRRLAMRLQTRDKAGQDPRDCAAPNQERTEARVRGAAPRSPAAVSATARRACAV